ncbi:MAG TPA: lipid A deacylase LpxR family protein [Woeseiaceae bacterium]|nr:lipid A deacylase LpxR family protein [Woeseiaceae bacterium]
MQKQTATLLLLALSFPALAAPGGRKDDPGTLTLLMENDAFAATDRHYTNGLEISWLSAPRGDDSVASNIAEWLPGSGNAQVRVGWQFGQSIFTPADKDSRKLVTDERPYAAWLYGGVSIVSVTRSHIDTVSLLLGTVGPNAKGDVLQSAVHEWLDDGESLGWANQVGNQAGGMLIVDRKWRTPVRRGEWLSADVMPHLGISLGNVAGYANAGFTLRLGNDLDHDFGPPHIRPSLPGSGYFMPSENWAWYLFAGADGRVVDRNIFVDDNDLEPLLDIQKRRWVTDVQTGFVLTRGDFRMACTFVRRSEEFDRQLEPDRFGSLAFTWRF